MTARQSQRQTSRLGTLAFEAPEVLENSGMFFTPDKS